MPVVLKWMPLRQGPFSIFLMARTVCGWMPSHSLNSMVPTQLERLVLVEGVGGFCLSRRSIELFAQSDEAQLFQLPQPINGNPQELIPLGLGQHHTLKTETQETHVIHGFRTAFKGQHHEIAELVSMWVEPGCFALQRVFRDLLLELPQGTGRHLAASLYPSLMAILDGLVERSTLFRAHRLDPLSK